MQSDREKFKNDFKKRIYHFVLETVRFLDTLPRDMVTRRIIDQLIRSAGSILANYVEGQAASSKKDFTNFFNHSLKSANESKVWFALLRDSGRAKAENTNHFLKELDELSKIFARSIITLKEKK